MPSLKKITSSNLQTAKTFRGYGKLYPFIELALGLMFVAGLGAGFNLPLSWATVGENTVMVLMAIYSLFIG